MSLARLPKISIGEGTFLEILAGWNVLLTDGKPKRTSTAQLCWIGRQLKKLLPFAIGVAFLVVFWPYIYYSSTERHFLNSIEKKIKAGEISFLVSEVANFEWDKICLFFGMDSIYEELKKNGIYTVSNNHSNEIERAENTSDTRIYVFSKNGSVNKTVYIPGADYNFLRKDYRLAGVKCVNRKEAVFSVYKKKNGLMLSLTVNSEDR